MAGLQPGQMIAEYRIISKIGKGGMATVYKAYQASVDRHVAIKILSYHLADDEEFLGRFKQEARLIARLEHPNILPIYDYGEDKGVPYLVMRFLDAGTLKDRMLQFIPEAAHRRYSDYGVHVEKDPGSRMPLDEIDSIFSQLADALGYAHDLGVIHRDIKPSNIMLDRRGRVFMTDFGIAKLIEPTRHGTNVFTRETVQLFTATGAITGTPDYMSPEQAQGLRLDQRSDIYSLGVVLFELLTGKVPFDAETPMAVILKQISEPLPPPSSFRSDLHPALEAALLKALEKSPAKRYSSMHEFLVGWKEAFVESKQGAEQKIDLPYHDLEPAVGQEGSEEKPASMAPVKNTVPPFEIPAPAPIKPRPTGYTGPLRMNKADEEHRDDNENQQFQFQRSSTAKFPETVKFPEPFNGSIPEPEKPTPVRNTGPQKNTSALKNDQALINDQSLKNAPTPGTPASVIPQAGSMHALEHEPWTPTTGGPYARPGDEARIFLQRRNISEKHVPARHPTGINRRILLIASSVALAILLLIGIAAATNLFDFLQQIWR